MKKILIPVLILIGLSSCNNYYKAITASDPSKAASFNDFRDTKKYYILRNGADAFAMKNISISSDKINLQCTLEALPAEHKLHLTNGGGGKLKYKKPNYTDEDETAVLNEVHIYLVPGSKIETGPFTLALENIQKAEIIEKDKEKTRKSHVMGTVIGVSAAVVLVGGIAGIIAASGTFTIF